MLTRALALRYGWLKGPFLYWGKIIGTLAGAATLKPWFVLLGLGVGHWFDSRFSAGYRRFEQQGASIGRLPEEYIRPLFQTIGHLAKADGRVTEDEIRAARAVMHRIGLGPAQVRHAINWFDEGKNPAFQLQATMRHLRRVAARRPEQRQLFVRLVLEVVLAKNRMSQKERGLIWTICSEFDIGRVELAQLETMIRAQRGFRESAAGDADARRIRAAYAALGIDQSATNDEVVKAYRRAMSRSHPDKIAADNPDKEALAAAENRTREVRAAYEMLKSRRSIR
jgi:DnaJ like chaperone protein